MSLNTIWHKKLHKYKWQNNTSFTIGANKYICVRLPIKQHTAPYFRYTTYLKQLGLCKYSNALNIWTNSRVFDFASFQI